MLTPNLATLSLTTNAAALWSAISADERPPSAEILATPVTVRVWRDAFSPRFVTMDDIEADALSAVMAGATFARLCDSLARATGIESAVERAGALLGNWLADALIVDIVQPIELDRSSLDLE